MSKKETYVVQARKQGTARWKDEAEYDDHFSANDHREDVISDGEQVDYRLVKRITSITDVEI